MDTRRISLFLALLLLCAALGVTPAGAQAAAVDRGISNTDVALSIYGAFSGRTTGDGIQQSPANAAGGIVEVRHIVNPLIGFEGTYSFNRANQSYTPQVTCGLICGPITPATVSADAHEVTAEVVGDSTGSHVASIRRAAYFHGHSVDFRQDACRRARH